jgi:hypothetical protein
MSDFIVTCNIKEDFIRDDEKRTLTFKGKTFSDYKMLSSTKETLNEFNIPLGYKGQGAKQFTKEYGMTPTAFRTIHNAIKTQQWIDPVRELSKRLCFGCTRKPIPHLMSRLHNNLPLIEEAISDNLDNIVPFIFSHGASPKDLKKLYGKSLWKLLCKNSFTRNNLLVKVVDKSFAYYSSIDLRKGVTILNQFPSTRLKRGATISHRYPLNETGLWLQRNKIEGSRFVHLYEDTYSMAVELGLTFKDSWGVAKMEERHKHFTDIVNAKKYSPEPFLCYKDLPFREGVYKGYNITLLDNKLAIITEGKVMHHCVGSYADRSSKGEYLVYSITKDGVRTSTLGLRVSVTGYSFSQHYGHCNAYITDSDEKAISSYILDKLNTEENHLLYIR